MNGASRRIPALMRRGGRSPTVLGGEAAYNPVSDLPSLRLALDAATVTLVGSDVDVWPDQSGNGQHFTAASAGVRPLWVSTGYNGTGEPYVEGDGSVEWLRDTTFSWGVNPVSNLSIIAITSYATLQAGRAVCNYLGTNNRPTIRHQTLDRIDTVMSASVAVTSATSAWAAPECVIARWNGTQSFLRVGGVDFGPGADAGAAHADGNAFAVLANGGGGSPSATRIAALYVCAAVLDADQIAAFEAYASARWGV